jgi:ketosteroid isomerase-like protein
MSQEHLELVRRGIEDVHVFWEMLDEQVICDTRNYPSFSVASNGVYVGRAAVIDANRHYWGTWNDYHLEAEELIDGGSSVVCVVRERGRGKGSGAPVERQWAQVWTFRRGRIIRWELFGDKAAALEAAGLAE